MFLEAAPPFNQATADVTFRSSDNVCFRLHKVILSLASPVFEGMFTIPRPAHGNDQPISVAEDSQTLDKLFRILYPIPDPPLETSAEVGAVLAAALKYDMDSAITVCKRALLDPALLRKDPYGVYAVALDLDLEDELRTSLSHILHCPYDLPKGPSTALWTIPVTLQNWFVQYRADCKAAAIEAVSSYLQRAHGDRGAFHYECAPCATYDGTSIGPMDFSLREDHYVAHSTDILSATPCGAALLEDKELGSTVFAVGENTAVRWTRLLHRRASDLHIALRRLVSFLIFIRRHGPFLSSD
ncbi:hypothetical protein SCP_0601390 [Sparassis crispa]|uniref:BTB domain-containing protein n=1 Tax=Sparassis crispa TaxID=139825 RepID=A0A401GPJ6_9APHY|nr:hypothetical protein SCP_0601390 [Sparassis crispa]GBE84161.1 hypothetical protein SCP_0601390 [Sparassis crispa]